MHLCAQWSRCNSRESLRVDPVLSCGRCCPGTRCGFVTLWIYFFSVRGRDASKSICDLRWLLVFSHASIQPFERPLEHIRACVGNLRKRLRGFHNFLGIAGLLSLLQSDGPLHFPGYHGETDSALFINAGGLLPMLLCGLEASDPGEDVFKVSRILPRPLTPADESQFDFQRRYNGREILGGIHNALERARHKHKQVDLRKVGQLRDVNLADEEEVALLPRLTNDLLQVLDDRQVILDAHRPHHDADDRRLLHLAHQVEPPPEHSARAPLRLQPVPRVAVEAQDVV
mmetsp:Transcript_10054/g.24751  ORF Transcript_10054/g.24751 Transcript_10054/m.24751 type:complete len:286 (+) Transcript_10054:396-1253(+)